VWAQIALDLVALTALLYFSGGADNPFAFYFVFHTVIAAMVFPGRGSVVVTSVAFGLYATMAAFEHWGVIPRFPLAGFGGPPDWRLLLARLFASGSTLYIVRQFTASLSRRLGRQSAELAAANAKLRQADRNRLQSVIMVAHELRSPAAAAVSLIETLKLAGGRGDELIERARQRLKGMLKMTDDVLDLHQMELGEVRFERQPLQLDRIAAEVVEELTSLAQAEQVTVTRQGLAELPPVYGDEKSVRFIVANLVSNAVRYNRPGGSVTIAARVADDGVEVHVTDSGVGIPAEDLPHVFDIFYRGTYARQKQRLGAGLGLSLVKRLVEVHGGKVGVTSTEGTGSDFTFSLPVASRPESA
jgi:signal transduction histidine kinase